MGLSVACQYDLTNKSVSNEVDLGVVGDLKHSMAQESIVDSPNVAMRVTDRRGEATAAAQVIIHSQKDCRFIFSVTIH
jgi:hypothetical protein